MSNDTSNGEENRTDDRSLVERIELEERHTDLKRRAEKVAERIEQVDGSGEAPEELEPSHRRLRSVSDELSGEPVLSHSELDEVAEFIEEQEDRVDDLDIAEQIGDLEERVRELKTEIVELEERKRELLNSIGMARSASR